MIVFLTFSYFLTLSAWIPQYTQSELKRTSEWRWGSCVQGHWNRRKEGKKKERGAKINSAVISQENVVSCLVIRDISGHASWITTSGSYLLGRDGVGVKAKVISLRVPLSLTGQVHPRGCDLPSTPGLCYPALTHGWQRSHSVLSFNQASG